MAKLTVIPATVAPPAHPYVDARRALAQAIARAIAPRKPLTVSEWADANRYLSSKGSAEPGRWRTMRNPPLREIMDCMSKRSGVHEVVAKICIQFGKTEVGLNTVGYVMDQDPGPMIVFLPDDKSMDSWINQKLAPMIEVTPACERALTSTASRNSANQRDFKDFAGGQLYVEHGKTATRLALKSARTVIVDELDKLAATLPGGENPLDLIRGRITSFPSNYKILYTGSPGIKGVSRLDALYDQSDRRRYYVPCPHCDHEQPLEWKGLQWTPDGKRCWYVCRDCGAMIEEQHKTDMIARGHWVPENPGAKIRGYQLNCLYHQFGIGLRWLDFVSMWRSAQHDASSLQVFVQERLAESWEDPNRRNVTQNAIADRAEPYKLRTAPREVIEVTVGVDTQDNRLAVHIVGWGRGMRAWTLDYVELPGDPDEYDPAFHGRVAPVWLALVDLVNFPIEREDGARLNVGALAVDIGGHKTEAVKNFVRQRLVRRPMGVFGATQNNAPPLKKSKNLADINWRGRVDRQGVEIWQVGTVVIKDLLFGRIGKDAEKPAGERMMHFSDELPPEFFAGIVSEVYNPAKNRYDKKRGARNEPLDTLVYAYAAAMHPELGLHRRTNARWDAAEKRIASTINAANSTKENVPHETIKPAPQGNAVTPARRDQPGASPRRGGGGFATSW